MFTDTHFHLSMVKNRGIDIAQMFEEMAQKKYRFLLDIGTEFDDFEKRQKEYLNALIKTSNWGSSDGAYIEKIMNFSVGLWPSSKSINNRNEYIKIIEKTIIENRNKIIALGECGIDRHYNLDNLGQEAELFQMQLELAQKLSLPVIVHSREDFEGTYDAIKNCGYNSGVIHCYSYGINEAKKFLDLGWHISFSGAITYTKKNKLDDMYALLRYVPIDMLLLETDAPYLAPHPFRGKVNTPVLVEYVFDFVANARGVFVESLCETVYKNAKVCYNL
ncbi:MAG: TatD family hydrolase [Treponema sp.]|nr:TatD family hydrolase [Treponema sp.]